MNGARFFRYIQDADWYTYFLNPVLDALQPPSDVLDVGTGPGKLIELGQARPGLHWTGIDTDEAMLAEARLRPALLHTPLYHVAPDSPLPFAAHTFDAITFCSVLFLLPDPLPLLQESWRILRPGGKIIALTPSGRGNWRSGLPDHLRNHALLRNSSFFLWRTLTGGAGRYWSESKALNRIPDRLGAEYQQRDVFGGMATLEVLQKG